MIKNQSQEFKFLPFDYAYAKLPKYGEPITPKILQTIFLGLPICCIAAGVCIALATKSDDNVENTFNMVTLSMGGFATGVLLDVIISELYAPYSHPPVDLICFKKGTTELARYHFSVELEMVPNYDDNIVDYHNHIINQQDDTYYCQTSHRQYKERVMSSIEYVCKYKVEDVESISYEEALNYIGNHPDCIV